MRHRQRSGTRSEFGESAERHFLSAWGTHIDFLQKLWILRIFRGGLHYDVVLVDRLVHGGRLTLTEGVVESGVDQLRRDAETRRGGAIVSNHRLQSAILLIA